MLVVEKTGLSITNVLSTVKKKYEYSLALQLLNFADCSIREDASVPLLKQTVVFKRILKESAGILRHNC